MHGTIAFDHPTDVDVYSFQGYAGTPVWIALDRTTYSLDTVVELIDADGTVQYRSDNWRDELTSSTAMARDDWGYQDVYSTNAKDAGMSIILPGPQGQQRTYYVLVESAAPASPDAKQTSGEYQLQIRLQSTYEHPGSTVRYADIRYAIDGISVSGLPGHSPLTADAEETESYDTTEPSDPQDASARTNTNDTFVDAQPVGDLLQSDQGMINISGRLDDWMNGSTLERDVDWYKFDVKYNDNGINTIMPGITTGSVYPVTFDVDYADGLVRPDTSIWVFDDSGTLILGGTDSGLVDDQPEPGTGVGLSDLTRGSAGTLDPYIGPVYLLEGHTYYVAVTCSDVNPLAADQTVHPTLRYEPIDSVQRLVEDNIGSQNASGLSPDPQYTLFPGTDAASLALSAVPYHLSDVVMYVLTDAGLQTVDPFTGAVETTLSSPSSNAGDLAMVPGKNADGTTGPYTGSLYAISRGATSATADQNAAAGVFDQIDTGTGDALSAKNDGLITYRQQTDPTPGLPPLEIAGDNSPAGEEGGLQMEALFSLGLGGNWLAVGNVGNAGTPPGYSTYESNLLYLLANDGTAINPPGVTADGQPRLPTQVIPLASLTTATQADGTTWEPDTFKVGTITGMSSVGGKLYAVADNGNLYEIVNDLAPEFRAFPDTTKKESGLNSIVPNDAYNADKLSVAHLRYIGTIKSDLDPTKNVDFAGLTVGPTDITETYTDPTTGKTTTINPYGSMLFGISSHRRPLRPGLDDHDRSKDRRHNGNGRRQAGHLPQFRHPRHHPQPDDRFRLGVLHPRREHVARHQQHRPRARHELDVRREPAKPGSRFRRRQRVLLLRRERFRYVCHAG